MILPNVLSIGTRSLAILFMESCQFPQGKFHVDKYKISGNLTNTLNYYPCSVAHLEYLDNLVTKSIVVLTSFAGL